MLVDDEPPLLRSIEREIKKCSACFKVVAKAYNGADALEKMPKAMPDVVFIDIKMPVMDGLALAKRLDVLYPDIFPVIISGYPDFEFAKEALKSGVVDYLLKPVEPELLCEVLERLSKKLEKIYRNKEVELLQQIIRSLPVKSEQILHYLNYKYFMAIIVRRGALPKSYSTQLQIYNYKPFESYDPSLPDNLFGADKCWVLDGRDENESIFIYGFKTDNNVHPESMAYSLASKLRSPSNFNTIVYSKNFFELDKLYSIIQDMYKTINQFLVIGKEQVLHHLQSNGNSFEIPTLGLSLENKLSHLIQTKSMSLLKDEISKLFLTWEQQSFTQYQVDRLLNQLARLIEKHVPSLPAHADFGMDQQFNEVLSSSTNFAGMLRGVWDIIEEVLSSHDDKDSYKKSTKDLFDSIESYISKNLSAPITLQSICDLFGISQPYLSRLFRKYKKLSFNEYITNKRINEARRLMEENPDMLVKDVARIVGYEDQHYFSRLFKSLTGLSPSDYKK